MPDGLPPGVSREAIERHIREHGVTRVPRGVSGLLDEHGKFREGAFKSGPLSKSGALRRKRGPGQPRKDQPSAPLEPPEDVICQSRRGAANTQRVAAESGPKSGQSGLEIANPRQSKQAPTTPQEPRTAPPAAPAPQPSETTAAPPRRRGKKALIAELIEAGKYAQDIAAEAGLTKARVYQIASELGLTIASKTAADRQKLRDMVGAGAHIGMIAEAFDCSEGAAYVRLRNIGLKAARKPQPQRVAFHAPKERVQRLPGRNGVADVKKAERARASGDKITDRRRFRTVAVPMGEPAVLLPADHEAVTGARTYFPSRVFEPTADERVLVDGCNNAKIGGDVLVGWLKGARVYTLTLEERATCPRSCEHWRSCYGSSMQYARRWRHGPALERRIAAEARQLCKAHDRVLVRLHVLGDFYSVEYVEFWQGLLIEHPGLHVFGFTAWDEGTDIGLAVAVLRSMFPRRWWMRHSGRTGPWGSFTIDFPTSKKRIGDALVCPEQVSSMNGNAEGKHCGNCAACWSCDNPIAFVEH